MNEDEDSIYDDDKNEYFNPDKDEQELLAEMYDEIEIDQWPEEENSDGRLK
jgi:hypothetical protein